jgi:hypothetical protein
MRRWGAAPVLLATLLVFVLHASTAVAAGFDLNWDACAADGRVSNKDFACDTDDGSHTMVASFVLDQPLTGLFLAEAVLDLIVAGNQPVPEWWDINDCRMFALYADVTYNPASVNCDDWPGGLDGAAMSGYTSAGTIAPGDSASHRRMTVIGGASAPVDLVADQDYFVFNLVLGNSSTVDPGACAGCTVPVCIVLNSITLRTMTFQELATLTTPVTPGGNFVTWQGGTGANCLAVPAKRTTWGAVKSLYR